MDEIQAAVLRIKLRHLDAWNAQRQAHAATYDRLLAGAQVGLPQTAADRSHIYYVYVVRSADRDALQRTLAEREIGTGIHFPIPTHLQPACRDLGYMEGDLPHTESAAREVLSIPMYAELTTEQLAWVASAVQSAQVAGAVTQA